MTNSFSVSGMMIAGQGVGATTQSAAHMDSSSIGEESSPPPQPPIASTEAPQMVSSVKLSILKKGEYILWTMKIEKYLAHTDYALWEVILNERKAKSTLLIAITDEHLAQFHGIKDAKTLWATIKTRFGGNDESKKMQKNVLKKQFEIFSVSNSKGLDKGTSSTNELNATYSVSTATGHSSQAQEELEQINQDDLEEIDLKWQVAMLSMKGTRGHFAKDCRSARNIGNMSRDAGNAIYIGRDNGKRPPKEEDEQALVVQNGLSTYDWSYQVEDEATDFTLMAFTLNPSISSSSNSEKFVLPTNVGKGIGHKESRPVWNNVQRINHQNKFAPTSVFTRSGRIPVSAAKSKAAASTSVAKLVNTYGPKQNVNFSRTRSTFHKSHSPIRRSFYNATTHSRRNSTERDNTARSKAVSNVKGNEVTVVKTLVGYVWRPRVNAIDQLSKDNRWICTRVDYKALKNKRIVDSGCFRHMIGNKAYLTDYQVIHDGGFVAFGSSRENQINKKVKVIRCDNGIKFKNKDLDEFCGMKGIKREYSNAKTLQQNKATEQKNRTLIEAARTMLADSLLPVTFWAKAVNNVCYVLNRALVTKTHNKTPYELLNGRSPRLDFMRSFGCRVIILNTLDPLGKFEGKVDEGFLVGYSVTSKDFRSSDDKPADDKPKDDIGSKTVEDRSIKKIKLTEMNLIG
uniref:Ribonuclease H-like domain-containing protein n=1 Tax=Tanacetum cinerariifolium TaxID=118510 RepID=A0A6L2LWJ3_TANCI|nr:ribonuclease H-like domain-containing protein [Tanacetum cinerariifolium]